MFKKKKRTRQPDNSASKSIVNEEEKTLLYPRPRICLFDFSEDTIDSIRSKGFNVTSASLGRQILVPNNNRYDKHLCLLNHNIPANIHEYDIICIDLASKEARIYQSEEHSHTSQRSTRSYYFLSAFPQTVFDPRPISAHILKETIDNHLHKTSVLVVFSSRKEEFEYTLTAMEHGRSETKRPKTHHNYDFAKHLPIEENRAGREIEVVSPIQELNSLLKTHLPDFHYEIVFYHPSERVNGKSIPAKSFIPLMRNIDKHIISFISLVADSMTLVFPQLPNKEVILAPLLQHLLPAWIPDIFPYSTTFAWKHNEDYWLPNHGALMARKEMIEKEYEQQISDIEKETEENTKQYSFLHDLITETDEALVDSVMRFLQWMGFDNVKKMDSGTAALREEDSQIEDDDKLIVIEVKGIGGTSTDSDCNQINKIKYRRAKERNSFNIFGIYIVNHQRYLPPNRRRNPPFVTIQISDAINEERGLISTWEMFKLFTNVKEGLINKSDARRALLKRGLIEFKPGEAQYLGKADEIYQNGTVIVLNALNHKVHIGDEIWVFYDDTYRRRLIENLQVNDADVEEARNCVVGMKLNAAVKKKPLVYLGYKSL